MLRVDCLLYKPSRKDMFRIHIWYAYGQEAGVVIALEGCAGDAGWSAQRPVLGELAPLPAGWQRSGRPHGATASVSCHSAGEHRAVRTFGTPAAMRTAAVLLVSWALAGAAAGQGQSCTVDDAGTSGDCRQIVQCPELLRIARTTRPNTPATQRLRQLVNKCGRAANGGLLICCQNEPTRTMVRLPADDQCGLQFVSKVIGGENAGVGEFPWMASIQYRETPDAPLKHGCGGTLITSRHVLTAAHCVSFLSTPEFPELTPVSITLGELDFNSKIDCDKDEKSLCSDPPISVDIDAIFPHPDFANNRRLALPRDIAVVKMVRHVAFTNYIRPVCLMTDLSVMPPGQTDLTAGKNALVAGWGRSEIASDKFTPFLQKATVPIKKVSECESVFNLTLPGRICAGGGVDGSDTCRGDSGGPLMIPLKFGTLIYQTGISSFGAKICGNVAGYTRIFDYRDWIVQQLNK